MVLAFAIFGVLASTLIGALLGSAVNRAGMGAILGLFLGPIGWIIVLLLPRETQQADSSPKHDSPMPSADLGDDSYRIWLGKTYNISRNELFEKYECDEKLFETLEDALQHAHKLNIENPTKPQSAQLTQNSGRDDGAILAFTFGSIFLLLIAVVISFIA